MKHTKLFKVRYLWKPAEHGFCVPNDQIAIGSTVTTGQTKSQVAAKFQTDHPHVKVESVVIVR